MSKTPQKKYSFAGTKLPATFPAQGNKKESVAQKKVVSAPEQAKINTRPSDKQRSQRKQRRHSRSPSRKHSSLRRPRIVTRSPTATAKKRPLEEEAFYHGMLPRADVKLLLTRQGDFMVRLTQKHEGAPKEQCISVMWNGNVRHLIPARTNKGGVHVDRLEFDNIADLIAYHHRKKVPLKHDVPWLLLNPAPKQDWELKKTQVELGKRIGAGAFGEVFKGTLTSNRLKIPIAVKVAHGDSMTKANLLEFMREARLMRQYDHDNVVRFYGVVAEEPVMIVMEFVSGGALDSHLRNYPSLTTAELQGYCLGAARGLQYLHAKRCMHRDVAARNCLIGDGVVKISDFGLCREKDSYKMNPKHKVPIRWLAPETLTRATYTFKSDVFSYGIMMWEVYSGGIEPYPDMTALEVQKKVSTGYRMPAPVKMPEDMKKILYLCWEADQERRPTFSHVVECMKAEPQRELCKTPPSHRLPP